MNKRLAVLLSTILVLGLPGAAFAYTAEISWYFDGVDIDTGDVYHDQYTFMILPLDPIEDILKPPDDIMPTYNPAVDFFADYDPATDIASLVFLPRDVDDPSRVAAVDIDGEMYQVPFDDDIVTLAFDADTLRQPMSFLTAAGETFGDVTIVDVVKKWSDVPEPSTLLLLAAGLAALVGFRRKIYKD